MLAEFVKWSFVAWLALGGILAVTAVGKPRKPVTSGSAAAIVLISALEIVLIVVFWRN